MPSGLSSLFLPLACAAFPPPPLFFPCYIILRCNFITPPLEEVSLFVCPIARLFPSFTFSTNTLALSLTPSPLSVVQALARILACEPLYAQASLAEERRWRKGGGGVVLSSRDRRRREKGG